MNLPIRRMAIFATVVAAFVALGWWVLPRAEPDEGQAYRDFAREHPTFQVARVILDEREVDSIYFRIFYRAPGDTTVREVPRLYHYRQGAWQLTPTALEK